MSLIDQFYPEEDEKKKKASQIAATEQKVKTTLLDKYYPSKEKVEEVKVEPKKPSIMEKIKSGFSKITESLSGKKKIEQQLESAKATGVTAPLEKIDTTAIGPKIIKENIFDNQINYTKTADMSATLTPTAKEEAQKRIQPAINEIQRLEAKSKTTEKLDWRDKIYDLAKDPDQIAPFVKDAKEIPEMVKLVQSADRLRNGKATIEDAQMLQQWLDQEKRDKSFGYKVLDVVSQAIPFGLELYLTTGTYTVGKESAKKGLKYLMTAAGKEAIEESLQKFGYKVATGIAGATVQSIATAPLKVTKDTLERQLVSTLTVEDLNQKESVMKSVTKSFLDNWVEVVSERSGEAMSEAFKLVSVPVKDKLLKTAIYNSLVKLNPGKNEAITTFLTKAGYNGVLNEMLEERIGEVSRGLLNKAGLSDEEFKLPTKEQLLVEAVAFSIPGVANVAINEISKLGPNTIQLTPDAAKETVEMSDLAGTPAGDSILNAATEAEKNGNLVLVDLDGVAGNKVTTPKDNNIGVSISKEQIIEKKEPTVTQEVTPTSPEALQTKEKTGAVVEPAEQQKFIEEMKKKILEKMAVGPEGETVAKVTPEPVVINEKLKPLVEEAKKYKTPEEFRQAIGNNEVDLEDVIQFHGTQRGEELQKAIDTGTINTTEGRYGKGFYLTTSEELGDYFGKQVALPEGGRTMTNKKPTVFSFDLSDLNIKRITDPEAKYTFTQKDLDKLVSEGYDGVNFVNLGETVIVNTKKLKSINLDDFYNKATGKELKKPEGPKEKQLPKQETKPMPEGKAPTEKPSKVVPPLKKKTTSEKVKTAKNITEVKSALKSVRKKISDLADEAEALTEVAKEKRAGLNTIDIAKLKRIYNRSQRFQEGDIETIRDSKWQPLIDRVIEDVQIKRPDLSEEEAFDYAMALPTKAEETSIKSEELKKLLDRQKILNGYLDKLEAKAKELTGKEKIERGDEVYEEWKDVIDAQEKLNKIITVKERVEAAQKPIEETKGETKLSKVAQRVFDKLVNVQESDITYKPMSIVEDAAKATEFVEQNPEMAQRIAKGLELPPPDITETAISIAAAQKALDNNDYLLYTRLILSRTFRQTRRGQEIVAERGRMDENSSEFFIRKLLEERAKLVSKGKKWIFEKEVSVQKVIAKEVKQLKNTIDGKVLKKLESAQKLIDSLTCKI